MHAANPCQRARHCTVPQAQVAAERTAAGSRASQQQQQGTSAAAAARAHEGRDPLPAGTQELTQEGTARRRAPAWSRIAAAKAGTAATAVGARQHARSGCHGCHQRLLHGTSAYHSSTPHWPRPPLHHSQPPHPPPLPTHLGARPALAGPAALRPLAATLALAHSSPPLLLRLAALLLHLLGGCRCWGRMGGTK